MGGSRLPLATKLTFEQIQPHALSRTFYKLITTEIILFAQFCIIQPFLFTIHTFIPVTVNSSTRWHTNIVLLLYTKQNYTFSVGIYRFFAFRVAGKAKVYLFSLLSSWDILLFRFLPTPTSIWECQELLWYFMCTFGNFPKKLTILEFSTVFGQNLKK